MASPIAVSVTGVSKSFRLPHERYTGLKQAIINFRPGKKSYDNQHVLKDISFEIKQGEFFGIVGRNGSGKSTLLKILAQIYTPEKGGVKLYGSLTPFIELGVGFNPELTGRENVYLNGALLGFDRRQVDQMYKAIVDFAELHDFMDQKLKNYSSGMQVRLAFSIAIRANSDILLLDEVLAVGDATFQQKCFKYFKELKKNNKTVILVSHDAAALQEYCDRGILIESGRIIEQGAIDNVIKAYLSLLNASENNQPSENGSIEKVGKRWGQGGIYALQGQTEGVDEKKRQVFTDDDEEVVINIEYKADKDIPEPVFGITITDASGARIFQSNTIWSKIKTMTVLPDHVVPVQWRIPNIFTNGEFSIAPAVADRSGVTIYDWCDDFMTFKVRKSLSTSAQVNIKHRLVVGASSKSKGNPA